MAQQNSMKQCPQCGHIVALDATECPKCSHKYRTVFNTPLNQTQAVPSPPDPAQRYGVHRGTLSPPGPQDAIEWRTSCFWFWIWLAISSCLLAIAAIVFYRTLTLPEPPIGALALEFIGCAGLGTWSTYCAMRLRRLYVYYAIAPHPWGVPAFATMVLVSLTCYYTGLLGSEIKVAPHASAAADNSGWEHMDSPARFDDPPVSYNPPFRSAPTVEQRGVPSEPPTHYTTIESRPTPPAPMPQPIVIDHNPPRSGYPGQFGFGGGGFGNNTRSSMSGGTGFGGGGASSGFGGGGLSGGNRSSNRRSLGGGF